MAYRPFPPPLTSQPLEMIELIPKLNASDDEMLVTTLSNIGGFDALALQSQIVSMLQSIDNDLKVLLSLSYEQFWAMIIRDKTIIQSFHSIACNLKSYITSSNPYEYTALSCLDALFSSSSSSSDSSSASPSSNTTMYQQQSQLFSDITTINNRLESIYISFFRVIFRISAPHKAQYNTKMIYNTFNKDVTLDGTFSSSHISSSSSSSSSASSQSSSLMDNTTSTTSNKVSSSSSNNPQTDIGPSPGLGLNSDGSMQNGLYQQHIDELKIFTPSFLVDFITLYVSSTSPSLSSSPSSPSSSSSSATTTNSTMIELFLRRICTFISPQSLSILLNESITLSTTYLSYLDQLTVRHCQHYSSHVLIVKDTHEEYNIIADTWFNHIDQSLSDIYTTLHFLISIFSLIPDLLPAPLNASQYMYNNMISILVRLFDYTLPYIAYLTNIHLYRTLIGLSGDNIPHNTDIKTYISPDGLTLESFMSSSSSSSLLSSSTASSPSDAMISPFSFSHFRGPKTGLLNRVSFSLAFLCTLVINGSILSPLGLSLPLGYIISHFFTPSSSSSLESTESSTSNSPLEPSMTAYKPKGFTDKSSSSLSNSLYYPLPTYTPSSISNLYYMFISLLSPQYNILEPPSSSSSSPSQENASDANTALPEEIGSNLYIYPDNNPYSFPGALLYFLPLGPFLEIIQSTYKHTYYTGTRPVFPVHIPLSTVTVLHQIHGAFKLSAQKLNISSSSSSNATATTAGPTPSTLIDIDKYDYNTLYIYNKLHIDGFNILYSIMIKYINIYESSLFDGNHNKYYIDILCQDIDKTSSSIDTTTTKSSSSLKNKRMATKMQSKISKGWGGGGDILSDASILANHTEDELFTMYLEQTNRTAKSLDSMKKSNNSKQNNKDIQSLLSHRGTQNIIHTMTPEERELYEQQFIKFAATYDDDYDDTLDDISTLYPQKATTNDDTIDNSVEQSIKNTTIVQPSSSSSSSSSLAGGANHPSQHKNRKDNTNRHDGNNNKNNNNNNNRGSDHKGKNMNKGQQNRSQHHNQEVPKEQKPILPWARGVHGEYPDTNNNNNNDSDDDSDTQRSKGGYPASSKGGNNRQQQQQHQSFTKGGNASKRDNSKNNDNDGDGRTNNRHQDNNNKRDNKNNNNKRSGGESNDSKDKRGQNGANQNNNTDNQSNKNTNKNQNKNSNNDVKNNKYNDTPTNNKQQKSSYNNNNSYTTSSHPLPGSQDDLDNQSQSYITRDSMQRRRK